MKGRVDVFVLVVLAWAALGTAASSPENQHRPGRRHLNQASPVEGKSTALVQDMLQQAVQLCTGDSLKGWQQAELKRALQEGGARQRAAGGADNDSTSMVLEVPGVALQKLESILGNANSFKLRDCLIDQLIGIAPPTISSEKQLVFNVLKAAVGICAQTELSQEAEAKLWNALDANDMFAVQSNRTSDDTISVRMEIDIEILDVVARIANPGLSTKEADSMRWCLQTLVMGAPPEFNVPFVAWGLLEGAQFSCTQKPFRANRKVDALLYLDNARDLIGFTDYDDGVGGSTGEGRVRLQGRYPISYLRDKFVPAVLSDTPDLGFSEEELLQCLLAPFGTDVFDGDDWAVTLLTAAHSSCTDFDNKYDLSKNPGLQKKFEESLSKYEVMWGSRTSNPGEPFVPRVQDKTASNRRLQSEADGGFIELWVEFKLAIVEGSASIFLADDPELQQALLPCYKQFLEGTVEAESLNLLELGLIDLAVPYCYPAGISNTAAGLSLDDYSGLWIRNAYLNGTVMVTSFEIADFILGYSAGHEEDSFAAAAVAPCIDNLFHGVAGQTGLGSSAAAQTVFAYASSFCAMQELSAADWGAVIDSLGPFLSNLTISAFVDRGDASGVALPAGAAIQWWEAENLTVIVNLPNGALSEVVEELGWEMQGSVSECLDTILGTEMGLRSPASSDSKPVSLTPAIIGGVLGAVIAVTAVLGLAVWLLKKQSRQGCKRSAASNIQEKWNDKSSPAALGIQSLLVATGSGASGPAGCDELVAVMVELTIMLTSAGTTSSPETTRSLSSEGNVLQTLLEPAGAWILLSYVLQMLRLKLGIICQVTQMIGKDEDWLRFLQGKSQDAGCSLASEAKPSAKNLLSKVKSDSLASQTVESELGIVRSTTIERQISQKRRELLALCPDFDIDFQAELRPCMSRKLGEGAHGAVFRGKFRGQQVAIKILRSETFKGAEGVMALKSFIKEVQIMSNFRDHPNIVRMLGASLQRPNIAIIYELMALNLHSRIHSPLLPPLTPLESMRIIRDLVKGLTCLHPEVAHRDLKPQNILLDTNGKAKIADFGLSRRVINPSASTRHEAGTPLYMPPEAFDGKSAKTKGDIYALGIIMNECLTRKIPYIGRGIEHTFQIIYHVTVLQSRPDLADQCPEEMKELIIRCWSQDPEKRPDIQEVQETLDRLWDTYFEATAKQEAETWTGRIQRI